MATLNENLLTIARGRYGKDVRAAIHDAIAEIDNTDAGYNKTSASPLNGSYDDYIRGISVKGVTKKASTATPKPEAPVEFSEASHVITAKSSSNQSNSVTIPNTVTLYSIGDVSDEVNVYPGSNSYTLNTGHFEFDGSSSTLWREVSLEGQVNQIFSYQQSAVFMDTTKAVISNRFEYTNDTTTALTTGQGKIKATGVGFWFIFPANTFADLAAFITWQQTHNIKVIYVRSTAYEGILTAEQSDAILALKTYDGVTTIESEAAVTVTYRIDVTGDIEALESDVATNTANIATNTADIADLKSNTGFEISSASPLNGCSASSIVGIDVDGCSTQTSANKFEQGGIGHTTNANYSANKVDNTTRVRTSDLIATVSGSTYTITCNSAYMVIVQSFNASKLLIDTSGTNAWNNPLTVTASNYMAIAVRKSDNSNISVAEAINANVLVNGSPIFSPTPTNPIAIVDASGDVIARNKNLFDVSKASDGYYWGYGTNTNNKLAYSGLTASDFIEVLPNTTYTITEYLSESGTGIVKYFKDKTTVSATVGINSSNYEHSGNKEVITFTTPSDTHFIAISCDTSSKNKVMVELGTTATDYIAYASNKITLPTLRSVGTVKDELIVNADGSGQIVKRIGVFTPTACWSVGTDANNGNHCAITLPSNIINDKVNVTVIADKLVAKSYNTRNSDVNIGRIYPNNTESRADFIWVQLAKGDTTFTDTTSATTFVKTLNIYYQLATPTTTTLTASEVSAIRQLQTYSGTTIIDSALDVKSVTYHADTKAYIDGRTDYSYSDTVIGKWADGKPLHRMVIETTTPSTADTTTNIFSTINGNDCDVKMVVGMLTVGKVKIPINYGNSSSAYTKTFVNDNGINMSVSSGYASKPCEIIVEYTLKNESAISVLSDEVVVASDAAEDNATGLIAAAEDEVVVPVITEG